MARRAPTAAELGGLDVGKPVCQRADIRSLVGRPNGAAAPARGRGVSAAQRRRHMELAEQLCRTEEWAAAKPGVLVALYAKLHAHVYGVLPAELDSPREWLQACRAAGLLVKRDFGGDAARAVDFMAWCWDREEGRERWRREHGRDGGRIGWRLQFSRSLLSDWRVDQARVGPR